MTKSFYTNHHHLTQAEKQSIVDYLLADRLCPADHDAQEFQNLSNMRRLWSTYLRNAHPDDLCWDNICLYGFRFVDGKVVDYMPRYNRPQEVTEMIHALTLKIRSEQAELKKIRPQPARIHSIQAAYC